MRGHKTPEIFKPIGALVEGYPWFLGHFTTADGVLRRYAFDKLSIFLGITTYIPMAVNKTHTYPSKVTMMVNQKFMPNLVFLRFLMMTKYFHYPQDFF